MISVGKSHTGRGGQWVCGDCKRRFRNSLEIAVHLRAIKSELAEHVYRSETCTKEAIFFDCETHGPEES